MYKENQHRGKESFVVIEVRGGSCGTEEKEEEEEEASFGLQEIPQHRPKLNLSTMKLFHRLRKIFLRLIFSVPSCSSSPSKHKISDRFEPPKTSCSSYYSSYSHYNEAIADCIEFFNKSAQDGILDGRKSDVVSDVV
ncbi:hypothetical protein VNO77_11423 [Canavalia gladiata]|uniref:Uncharacterized protein n=1 Tax=Canavalia gladiata TaxID=3824 RepID=A0AAN9QXP2_CANGL